MLVFLLDLCGKLTFGVFNDPLLTLYISNSSIVIEVDQVKNNI